MYTDLLLEKIPDCYTWIITLQRPKAKNAISLEMIDSLKKVIGLAARDNSVRVVILTGAEQTFSAGGDIKEMKNQSGMFKGEPFELSSNYEFGIQEIPKLLEAFNKPLIAMVNGEAIGAGCDLAFMCDLRIGCEKTQFIESFAKLGLVPGDGGTFFLTRALGYARAMEMFLMAKGIGGKEALDLGLINFYFTSDNLRNETIAIAKKIAQLSPIAISMTKKALKEAYGGNLQGQLTLLSSFQGITQRTKDHAEAIDALFEKRKPNFIHE